MNMKECRKRCAGRVSRFRIISFTIGMTALLIYEFIGLPYYRPYIYSNHINDFHMADTLGNTLGTIALIFLLIALFSDEKGKGRPLIKFGTIIALLMELLHPLLGKSIDIWDILATLTTGMLCLTAFNYLFKDPDGNVNEVG